ncbi:MAG: hypothetical protein ACK5LC_13035 [Coprobacillaceae bacterium]
MISYETIKEDVYYDYEEYISEEGLTVTQSTSKLIEKWNKRITKTRFVENLYFTRIAIESIKRGEIADFIYDRVIDLQISDVVDNELPLLIRDISEMKYMLGVNKYVITETSLSTKARINYILDLNNQ